jgi:hypothetical protein
MAGTGHMLFVSSDVGADGVPAVLVSKGVLGSNWTDPRDFGSKLVRAPSGVKVVTARVTAAAYTKATGYVHLIYMEKYGASAQPGQYAAGQTRAFNKTYAVLRWQGDGASWAGRFDDIKFGQPVSLAGAGPAYRGLDDNIFDDLHDSIVVWHDPSTENERIFTAFNDYGDIRFAEVKEEYALAAIPLPPLAPPPIPVTAESGNAVATGAAAGALMALMLLRLLAAKSKTTTKVEA